jgi:hypothetical protein
MLKYASRLGDEEFSYWPTNPKHVDCLKVSPAAKRPKEYISTTSHISIRTQEVDGSITIQGVTYKVKNVEVSSTINRV